MARWSINRVCALVLGVIFLILGLIGFVTPYEAGTNVKAIFGLFDVDTLQNVFNFVVGLLGIAAAFTGYSRTFNKVFGVVFIALGLLGLIPALYFPAGSYNTDSGLFLGLTHLNAGDHILHLIAGVLAAVVGYVLVGTAEHPRRKATA